MNYVTFGRTGIEASIAGLGCGGHSRLGQRTGASEQQSVDLVKAAIDLGINFIDTATAYGTEEIVGQAIAGQRDNVIISTKEVLTYEGDAPLEDRMITAEELLTRVEGSLKRLNIECIDILHLHGAVAAQYDHCCEEFIPVLNDLRTAGKIRFTGITERFVEDTDHAMLKRAMMDDHWDVTMIGFNLLNPSAIQTVFPKTHAKQVATLGMFAVRRALSNPQVLRDLITGLSDEDLVNLDDFDLDNPLGFLISEGGAETVVDGAYRYCRHTEGLDVILTGTGNLDHLKQNIASINSDPLNPACLQKLDSLFGKIDTVSGN